MKQTVFPAQLEQLYQTIDGQTPGSRNRPIIGISANQQEGQSMICNTYVQSVLQAGGVPLLLPVHTGIDELREVVRQLDGLLLSGGGDINPLYEKEEPVPGLGSVDAVRDQYDFTLLKLATDRQIPVFGICRGHQVINIAFGGKNYQDIATQYPEKTVKHTQNMESAYGSHTVTLTEGSLLSEILGQPQLVVNSIHHQAIREVAPGFSVSARSADGIVEAMEGMPHHRIFSVQWHPEKMAPTPNGEMQQLFRYFISEAALFRKAKAIHRKYPIIDSHCDTPMKLVPGVDIGKRTAGLKVDLPKMEEGHLDGVFMVAYIPQGERDELSSAQAFQKAIEILYTVSEQVEQNSNQAGIAYTENDLAALKAEGRKAIFFGVENGYALGKKTENVAIFKEMGVSYITLCHNGNNDICDSSKGEPEHNGLSEFGKEVVQEMNRHGLLIDLSHASEKSFFDVLKVSRHPVIASHSSARALCQHHRNLTDKQLVALAENGGVVQVCLYPAFLNRESPATISDAVKHINHMVQLIGINHVGIGSDFDGDDNAVLAGCSGAHALINLTVELLRQGYSEEDLGKLWGGNLFRVLTYVQQHKIK